MINRCEICAGHFDSARESTLCSPRCRQRKRRASIAERLGRLAEIERKESGR